LDPRGVIHGRGQFKSKKEAADESNDNNDDTDTNPGDDAVPLTDSEKPKEHLFRDNFVLDFDTMRLAFRPHPEKRVIVVHAAELRRNSNSGQELGEAFQVGPSQS